MSIIKNVPESWENEEQRLLQMLPLRWKQLGPKSASRHQSWNLSNGKETIMEQRQVFDGLSMNASIIVQYKAQI